MATLVEVAIQTQAAVKEGGYTAPSGRRVALRALVDRAVAGTELVEDVPPAPARPATPPRVTVTDETTAQAARRLADAGQAVVALNFASAINPGGGYVRGAKAQEEDLCRSSALYPCLLGHPDYYRRGRADGTSIYPDLFLWSPEVPFFRDDSYAWLETPFTCSIVTAAAPFAKRALEVDRGAGPAIRAALARRTEKLGALLAAKGARRVVLGAWGCGAFGNDPVAMAEIFARLVPTWPCDEIVFAVYDRRPPHTNLRAFQERLG